MMIADQQFLVIFVCRKSEISSVVLIKKITGTTGKNITAALANAWDFDCQHVREIDLKCVSLTSNVWDLAVCMNWDAFNKVDIVRFRLQSTMIRYNFLFDVYLHLRWLCNYGGCVHISLFLVQILSKKMTASKINSNLKKWLFQIGWLFGYFLSLCRNTEPRCKQNSVWKRTL